MSTETASTSTQSPEPRVAPFAGAIAAILTFLIIPIAIITVATYRGTGVTSGDFALFMGLLLVAMIGSLGTVEASKTDRVKAYAGLTFVILTIVLGQLIMGFGAETISGWLTSWVPGQG